MKTVRAARAAAEPSHAVGGVQAANITPFFEMKAIVDLKWLKHVIVEEQKISKAISGA